MTDRPVLFLLHGLGCSARSWDDVVDALGDTADCVALDLPGHGDWTGPAPLTVEQTAAWLTEELVRRQPASWALVGHSMSGKLATIVTARAERGVPRLAPPLALVLVAASPLTPEPMADDTRAEMIRWCADGPVPAEAARQFVDANTTAGLAPEPMRRAVQDVQRVDPAAWLAWLQRGSLEDWSDEVGRVRTSTLVVAGAEDGELGAAAQSDLVLPRVTANRVVEVPDAAHLIMIEQPATLARLVTGHLAEVTTGRDALPAPALRLLASDRVSARTRATMLGRLAEPTGGPHVLDVAQHALLTALLARVLPQRGTSVDLASRIDATLAAGAGDGWRFADLPPDPDAWRQGLDTLAAVCGDFAALYAEAQDGWVAAIVDGRVGSDAAGHLTADRMTLWFEDVRAEAVRTWLSHPAAMARIGYDGFANGGDGLRKQGYLQVAPDTREPWQLDLPARGRARS